MGDVTLVRDKIWWWGFFLLSFASTGVDIHEKLGIPRRLQRYFLS